MIVLGGRRDLQLKRDTELIMLPTAAAASVRNGPAPTQRSSSQTTNATTIAAGPSIWSVWNQHHLHQHLHHQPYHYPQLNSISSGTSNMNSPPTRITAQSSPTTMSSPPLPPPSAPSPSRSVLAAATSPSSSRSITVASSPAVEAPIISPPGGCFARTFLPAGARSTPICSRTADFARTAFTHRQRLGVSVGRGDRQVLQFSREQHGDRPHSKQTAVDRQWIAHARLADDMHGNNAVVEVHRRRTTTAPGVASQTAELRVRVLRDVPAGEELQLWFSEELLAMLSIPFLTPAQISIGQNQYTCTVCTKTYDHPNPLKLHLATECDRLSRDDLWRRIDSTLSTENLAAAATNAAATAAAAAAAAASSSQTMPLTFAAASGSLQQHLHSWLTGTFQHLNTPSASSLFPALQLNPFVQHHQLAQQLNHTQQHQQPPQHHHSHQRAASAFQPPHPQNASNKTPPTTTSSASPMLRSEPTDLSAAMMMLPTMHPQHAPIMSQPQHQLLGSSPSPPQRHSYGQNSHTTLLVPSPPASSSQQHQLSAGHVQPHSHEPWHQHHHRHHVHHAHHQHQPPSTRQPQPQQPQQLHNLQFHLQHQQHSQSQLPGQSNADAEAAAAAAEAAASAAAAHLETIVSNMGTHSAKQHSHHAGNAGAGGGGGHLCIYCGKVYSRKYGLKIHIRTHTGFKPLKCPYCSRPFGDPSNLNKHVRLHVQGNTIYKCAVPDCDKILVRRRDLQRHMQTQHGDEAPAGEELLEELEDEDDEDVAVDVGGAGEECTIGDDDDDDVDCRRPGRRRRDEDAVDVTRTKRIRSESPLASPVALSSSNVSSPTMVEAFSSDDD